MTRVLLATVTLVLAVLSPPIAVADPDVHAGGDFFNVSGSSAVGGTASTSSTSASGMSSEVITEPACTLGGQETCNEPVLCDDGSIMTMSWSVYEDGSEGPTTFVCPDGQAVEAPPEVTPGLVLTALRRIGLPASELVVQPPGGRTLVNFDTNFYTENGEFTRVVRLLGRRVELRIWPSSYGWRFGDGATRQTAGAGSPYPDLEITHRYLSTGRVGPRVDTTYAAEFRVGGGPWRDVAGTVTIPGESQGLRVVTARPVLVGY